MEFSAARRHKAGEREKRLAGRRIRFIWSNETNLGEILKNLQKTENSPPDIRPADLKQSPTRTDKEQNIPPAAGKQQRSVSAPMRDLLEQLKEPLEDQEHARLLEQVKQLSADFLQQTGLNGCLALFGLLENHRNDRNRSRIQRQGAARLSDTLLTDEIKNQLADTVADPSLKISQRRALAGLLVGLRMKIAARLLTRLHAERAAVIRRHYVGILARMGEATFELLAATLQDETWYVVRNAVTVLGETRLETALPLLTTGINHPEVRVRRAVIHALSAIGGDAVIPLLLRLARDEQEELQQPASMALGALGNPQAIPPLVVILNKFDLSGKKTGLKIEVIHALTATKSPRAIIPLLKLARRRNLLNRKNLETLRAEAILALGQLGNTHLIPLLERLPKSNKDPVSRAIKQATAQLRKQKNVV